MLKNASLTSIRIIANQPTVGTAFGGGAYFEASLSFDGSTNDHVPGPTLYEGCAWLRQPAGDDSEPRSLFTLPG